MACTRDLYTHDIMTRAQWRAVRVAALFRGCDARTVEQRRPEVHGHVRSPPSRFSDSGSAAWSCCKEALTPPTPKDHNNASQRGGG